MAIDIRATTTCSLGTLISASVSDDYIQGTGLIKTKGSCEISGTIVPATGTVVTFSYTKGGVTRTIPRKLRVLSSFADPFRRTTKVELGCKLTLLQDVSKVESWRPGDDPANADLTEEDNAIITSPIHADSIAAQCLSRLDISGSVPLTNSFSIAKFDFSPGYVTILSDLLVSECKCGYLDFDETLQLINLSDAGGTGPVIPSSKIIDVAPIGLGQLPADAVTVAYSTLKLKTPAPPEEAPADPADPTKSPTPQQKKNWEKEEVIGLPTKVQVANPWITSTLFGTNLDEYFEYSYNPRTITYSEYDTLDRLTTRTTTEYTILAAIAPSYVQSLTGPEQFGGTRGQAPSIGSQEFTIVTKETYEYKVAAPAKPPTGELPDGYEEITRRTLTTTEPEVKLWASTSIFDLKLNVNADLDGFSLSSTITAEKTIETYENGTTADNVPCVKTLQERFLVNAYTLSGQQSLASSIAKNGENAPRNSDFWTSTVYELMAAAKTLEPQGVETQITSGRDIGLQQRPGIADRIKSDAVDDTGPSTEPKPDPNNGWRTASESGLALATGTIGTGGIGRVIRLSLPYAPDDIFTKTGIDPVTYAASGSDASAKARAYGRAQNRLLHGNRFGCNFQMAPETLPSAPFAPFIVQANGLSALYRNNGTSWTLSSDGVLASTDALFWGAVGGTGTFWFPVAPGITTLPTTPPVVDGEMTVTNPVPVWNETVPVQGALVLGATITSLPYALNLLTTPDAISVVLGASIAKSGIIPLADITYSQSSVYIDNTAATNAGMTDGSFNTGTETGTNDTNTPEWIRLDLGAVYAIGAVVVGSDYDAVIPGGWDKTYTEDCPIEISNDGTTWTVLTNTGTFTAGIQTYPVAAYGRYLRIVDNGGGFLAATEFYPIGATLIQVPTTTVTLAPAVPTIATGASVAVPASAIALAAPVPSVSIV